MSAAQLVPMLDQTGRPGLAGALAGALPAGRWREVVAARAVPARFAGYPLVVCGRGRAVTRGLPEDSGTC